MIDLSQLHLNAATHTYTWNGQVVPGVTSILARLGYLEHVPMQTLQAAMDRGTRVHKACELDDHGDLDEDEAADVMGYVRAWRQWQEDHAASWMHIERPIYHDTLRYAGTPDRCGRWARPIKGWPRTVLVDLKSGPWHPIMDAQLAAYFEGCKQALNFVADDRIVVQLSADGTYKIHERTPAQIAEGWSLFVNLLSVGNWSARHL